MSENSFYDNLIQLVSGIEVCLEKKLVRSALILIYAGIDAVAWLDSMDTDATRSSFLVWVDNYLLKVKPLGCTALDLYAARCGLLHTLTPDSRLSSEGKVRQILYAWGVANAAELQRNIDITTKSSDYIAVHVSDLYEGLRDGILAFTKDIALNPVRKERTYTKARRLFSDYFVDNTTDIK
jgi:hypothetical protein